MRNLPIGIIDSGVGGLTAVVQMNRLLENESILYFGDSLRMPYGNRPDEEIIFLANSMIKFLEKQNVKAILIACNTISSHIEKLSSNVKLFSIVDAGVSALKNAPDKDEVGVIATNATIKSGIYERKIKKELPQKKVYLNSSTSLPKIIDSHLDDIDLLNKNIKLCIDPIIEKSNNLQQLILGCSHFPIIHKEISQLYPQLSLIDPAKTQVEMLKDYLTENDLTSNQDGYKISLYTTASTYEFAAAIKRLKLEINTLIKTELLEND